MTEGERLLEQGMERGLLEGERRLLRRLLAKRFEVAVLPTNLQQRIQQATAVQLETWGERVLDAPTLEDVFK